MPNEQAMLKKVWINGEWVEYELTRKNIKNLYLRVSGEGQLMVSAPKRLSLAQIEEFIAKNEAFIKKSQIKMRDKINLSSDFINQGYTYFLGEKVAIEIYAHEENSIRFVSSQKQLLLSKNAKIKASTLLNAWLDEQAKEYVQNACAKIYPLFMNYGVEYPQITLRQMKARWGSCAVESKKLTFNKKLIHVPLNCLEYVVVHEFAHFLEPNHSAAFYRLLDELRPSWRTEREILTKYTCR